MSGPGSVSWLNRDETGRTLLLVSNVAGMSVANDDWTDLLSLAVHIDPDHWLVRELSSTEVN